MLFQINSPRSFRLLPTVIPTITALLMMGSAHWAFAFQSMNDQHHNVAKTTPKHHHVSKESSVQLGPRPFFLIENMDEGALKQKLSSCKKNVFAKTDFSIGHRGAPLQFPEHTKESYEAAAKMGAGVLECDVTFTQDKQLVCRHSQCDLHTTTNILATPLAVKCSTPFQPAVYDANGTLVHPATANCCTSDITLDEFKTLSGKMDAADARATTVESYINATPAWHTDLYSEPGTLLTHKESIELFQALNVKMTPELKSPAVDMPYQGNYTQADYAQQMINDYKHAGVSPRKVLPQSFNLADIQYWLANEPRFAKRAVYLDGRNDDPQFDVKDPNTWSPSMAQLSAQGVNIIAPPLWMLLDVDPLGNLVASTYAKAAKAAGLEIITWTLERSGPLNNGGGWYYQSVSEAINNDGDMLTALDVLAKDVGVIGVFSDWPATTSFYANCMKLK